jgi:hypothetical protein
VVFIPTPIGSTERRRAVLRQFRREQHTGVHLIFVLGTRYGQRLEFELPAVADVQKEIQSETHHPSIRYLLSGCRDLGDEPHNPNGTSATACKVYEGLRHISAFYEASPPRFVWRGADDAYLDLAVFRSHVAPVLQTCRLFAGRIRLPRSAYDLDLELNAELYDLYGLKKFGKYMVGMGYVMSWDVARFIGASSIPPRQTWCEDIMVSHWLLFYDVDFVDLPSTIPGVQMFHADEERTLANEWVLAGKRVLLAHRMSADQWRALEQRPVGQQGPVGQQRPVGQDVAHYLLF